MHANLVLDRTVSWAATPQQYLDRNHYWIEMMGRLRPGVTLAQAQATLAPAQIPAFAWGLPPLGAAAVQAEASQQATAGPA